MTTITVEARVESIHQLGERIGYQARVVIHNGIEQQSVKQAREIRTNISDAWNDANTMRQHELTKRDLPVTN